MTPSLPYFMMQFPSRAKDATVKESVQLWQDRVSLDLVLHLKGAKAAITVSHRGSRWEVVWNFDWHARNILVSDQLILGAFSSHSCFSASPLWSEGADSGRGHITSLEEWNQVRLDPRGFCSHTGGPVPSSSEAVLAPECRRTFGSHLALALSPLSPVLAPTTVMTAIPPWGRTWLMLLSDQGLPPKPLGIQRL